MNDYRNNNDFFKSSSMQTQNNGMNNQFDDFDQEPYYDTSSGYGEVVMESSNQSKVVARAFLIMFVVLVISGITAIVTASSGTTLRILSESSILFYGALFFEIIIVVAAETALDRRNEKISAFLLLLYSVVNGFTLSVIFLAYDTTSIVVIFFIAATMFGTLGVIGSTIKKDLSTLGSVAIMLLVGIILVSFVNIFIGSAQLNLFLVMLGLAVFIGLTAYDFQKIKTMGAVASDKDVNSFAMFGALTLYLDFINLFLRLLKLFAKARD